MRNVAVIASILRQQSQLPRRVAGVAETLAGQPANRKPATLGDAPFTPPMPPITDMRAIDEIMSRGPSDPHVDIVVMYRRRCGHCKPEIKRVHEYAISHPNVSAYAVEVDSDPNIDWLKGLLLGPDEPTPSTGYFAHGKLQLSSPSRRESVQHWVDIARSSA